MTTMLWVIVGIVVIGAVAALVVVGVNYSRNVDNESDPVMARLADATSRGEVMSLEQAELEQPFTQRVILPMIRKLGEISNRYTPQNVMEDAAHKLELAGNPAGIDASTFLASRFVFMGLFVVLVIVYNFFGLKEQWPVSSLLMYTLGGGVFGFYLPQLLLKSRTDRRQGEIRNAMPDALDLLTICVEAGLGFDAAMSKVAEKWENELSYAFGRCIREVQLGKPNREALRDMANRIGIPEMTSFTAAIIQSQTLGVSMAKVLRIQSDQMRIRRRQAAEEKAHQAPVKMIIPMAFLTMPTLLIVLMTPAAISISETLGK